LNSPVRLFVIAIAILAPAAAQQFDIAAIKPHANGAPCGESNVLPGGRLVLNCLTLREIVSEALDIVPEELGGGPDWVKTELWDLIAKAEGVSGEMKPRDYRARLLALLDERFHLKIRRESKQVSGFVLVRARNRRLGPALAPNRGAAWRFDVDPGISLTVQRTSMSDFAEWLKSPIAVGKTVEDRTGLSGEYDLMLTWGPMKLDGTGDAPSIFTALREQLGLQLRGAKVRADVFAIEQAEHPLAE
jgi:uncharacterized protein (TIGR03435 family)